MKKYFLLFIITFVPFGIITGSLSIIFLKDFNEGVILGIEADFYFGIIMTFIFGSLDIIHKKSLGGEIDNKIKQNRELSLDTTFEETYDLCLHTNIQLKGFSIKQADFVTGFIYARTNASWKSWGEKITLNLQKLD